jgi:hypothetical protein
MPQGSLTDDEQAFQQKVIRTARRAGWRHQHTYKGRTGKGAWRTNAATGFPDLLLVKRGRMLALELKAPGGAPSPEQLAWIELLDTIPGCTARVVYPADWPWIMQALTTPAPRYLDRGMVPPPNTNEGTDHD